MNRTAVVTGASMFLCGDPIGYCLINDYLLNFHAFFAQMK